MWTTEFSAEANNLANDDDGILFMPLHVFRDNFVDLTINHYNDDWKVDTLLGDHKVFDYNF